jgi:hypothetical protein
MQTNKQSHDSIKRLGGGFQRKQEHMRHETIYDTATEEWRCPICGFRTRIEKYWRVVIEVGDRTALHSGTRPLQPVKAMKDPYLKPFEDFMRDIDT